MSSLEKSSQKPLMILRRSVNSLYIIVLLCCCSVSGNAQHTQTPSYYIKAGDACFQEESYGTANTYYDQAFAIAEQQNDYKSQAIALVQMGECAFQVQDFNTLRSYNESARFLIAQHLDSTSTPLYFTTLQNIGVAHSYLGRPDLKERYYRRAFTFCRQHFASNDSIIADAYFNMAAEYYGNFQLDSALLWFDTCLLYAERVAYKSLIGPTLLNQSVIHADLQNYDEAILLQQKALNSSLRAPQKILSNVHLADYMSLVDGPAAGLSYLQAARVQIDSQQRYFQPYHSFVERKLAEHYLRAGDTISFETTLKSLRDWIPDNDENFTSEYKLVQNLSATSHLHKGQYQQAEQVLQSALDAGKGQTFAAIDVATRALQAKCLFGQQYYEGGLQVLQQILTEVTPGFDTREWSANPPVKSVVQYELVIPVLEQKMKGLLACYREKGQIDLLNQARSCYYTADSLILLNRRKLRTHKARVALRGQLQAFYEQSIALFYELYQQDQNARALNEAFLCLERSKSLALSEGLRHRSATSQLIPATLREREQALATRSAYLNAQIQNSEEHSKAQVAKWQVELVGIDSEWSNLLTTLETEYPAYMALKYDLPQVSVQQVQERLLPEEGLLLHFLELEDAIYCLSIGTKHEKFHKLALEQPLSVMTTTLLENLHTKSNQYYSNGFQLYQQLLAPILQSGDTRELIIIPDGHLWRIPFGALPTSASEEQTDEVRFLVQDYEVSYWYACHERLSQQLSSATAYRYQIAAFSPFEQDEWLTDNSYLAPLPGSIAEMQSIEDINFEQTIIVRGDKASKEQFGLLGTEAKVLHLATHAVADPLIPSRSHLVFSPTSPKPRLYAYQLFDQPIAAQLAVLSACQSADGRLETGEGLAGLARAFALNGCSNLIASLWPINDEIGPVLLEQFYQELYAQQPIATAFNNSIRQYLEKQHPLMRHPHYWGAMIYLGDNRQLSLSAKDKVFQWQWLIVLGGVLLFLAYYYRRVIPRNHTET